MDEPFIPCGPWLPDQPDYNNPGCSVADNVVPVTRATYAPMPAFKEFATSALPTKPIAAYSARDGADNAGMYAGTATKLYASTAGTSPNFTDVSGGATYTATSWAFATMGASVFATNGTDALLSAPTATTTAFAAVGGNAPKAKVLAVVRPGFLVCGNINDTTVGIQAQGARWSALDDATVTGWPLIGSNAAIAVQSDWQNIPGDHGVLQAIAPDLPTCAAAIFMEEAIFQMIYTGDDKIFSFQAVEKSVGTPAPRSVIQRGQRVYYLGPDGFYAFDGTQSIPIGSERVNRTFLEECDPNQLVNVAGIADRLTGLCFWAYSTSAAAGTYDRMICYNTVSDRWSHIIGFSGYSPFLGRTLGVSLDGIDALGYTLDSLPFSLDSAALTGGKTIPAAFSTAFKSGFFAGTAMAWTVETTEKQLYAGGRARVGYVRPAVEGDIASAAVAGRVQLKDAIVYGATTIQNVDGICPARSEGRYHRVKMTGAAASMVTHIQGASVGVSPAGGR